MSSHEEALGNIHTVDDLRTRSAGSRIVFRTMNNTYTARALGGGMYHLTSTNRNHKSLHGCFISGLTAGESACFINMHYRLTTSPLVRVLEDLS